MFLEFFMIYILENGKPNGEPPCSARQFTRIEDCQDYAEEFFPHVDTGCYKIIEPKPFKDIHI